MVSLIADALLDRLVGPYARLGKRKLDLTGGSLLLKNVELRHDVLDGLGLPVAVRGGEVGELEITVPWTKLRTDSVVVRIHQLSLLLAPVCEAEWDEPAERKRAAAAKERELAALQARSAGSGTPAGLASSSSADERASKAGWVERLMQRVLDNLQVVVTSAMVRFEDYSHSGSPFGIEVAMDSLWFHPAHVDSADAAHRAPTAAGSSGGEAPPFRHREVLVCALCAYMLQGPKLEPEPARQPLGLAELRRRLESSGMAVDAPAAMRLNENACMLEPVSFAIE
eukprot:scaffold15396_cov140-Isochrysis_galbana.AAC.1